MPVTSTPQTLLDFFQNAVESGKPDLLLRKVNGTWTPVSAGEFGKGTRALAAGLAALGIDQGDRVCIMAENRPEWAMSDFAVLSLGAITVPIFTTFLAPQVEHVFRDSGAKAAIVSGADVKKILEVRKRCPDLQFIIVMDEPLPQGDGIVAFSQILRTGEANAKANPRAFDERVASIGPDTFATVIYTSGTTGEPKGAVLTHKNFVSNIEASIRAYNFNDSMVALSFLPLAHVFERTTDYLYFSRGMTIAYAESIDKLGENFLEVKPHFFAAVPRVYEKVLARIQAAVENAPALRQRIFHWSVATGKERINLLERKRPVSGLLEFKYKIADKLVFAKIRSRLGGRFEFAISGGAPLARDVAEFFWAAGVKIYEGFGLTETSPVLTANAPDAWRLGTVGKPIAGVSIKVAEDGEILAKGPNVMKGYWRKKEETDKVFTPDGWFMTGDIGRFDSDGFLTITDRKKELLVTAYGKNVAPAPIEGALKTIRYVGSAVLIGDRRKFLSALIAPNFEAVEGWARAQGIAFDSRESLIKNRKVRALFQQAIDIVNGDEPSERRIKAFALLPNDLTIDGGELTPTLKLRRRVIAEKYAAIIDGLYTSYDEKGDAFQLDTI